MRLPARSRARPSAHGLVWTHLHYAQNALPHKRMNQKWQSISAHVQKDLAWWNAGNHAHKPSWLVSQTESEANQALKEAIVVGDLDRAENALRACEMVGVSLVNPILTMQAI